MVLDVNKKILMLGLIFFLAFSILSINVHATWWNESFSVKVPINISVLSETTEKLYSILLNITYDSDMNVDFSDLRFVNASENTELNYWVEDSVNSSWAYVWVEIAENITSANQTLIYMYYGNLSASTTSNFVNTFIEGDTFTRANNDVIGYTEIGNRLWTERVLTGAANFSIISNQLKMITTAANDMCYVTNSFSQYNLAMDFILYVPSGATANWAGVEIRKTAETDTFPTSGINIYFRDAGSIDVAGGSPSGDVTGTFTAGQNNRISIRAYDNSIYVYVNDNIQLNFTEATETGGYLDFADYALANVIWDSFRVRKYYSSEPTYNMGAEESRNAPPTFSNNVSSTPRYYSSTIPSWFNATWSDDNDANGFYTPLLEINYTTSYVNYTANRDGNKSYYSIILPQGTFGWRMFANDSSNAWNKTELQHFTINNLFTYSQNSTNATYVNTSIEHRLFWNSTNVTLSGYIFSFDNCRGSFVNDTWVSMPGLTNWSNVTKTINITSECTIRWCVYANDSVGNWNSTSCTSPFNYKTTGFPKWYSNMSLTPSQFSPVNSTFSVIWNNTFDTISKTMLQINSTNYTMSNSSQNYSYDIILGAKMYCWKSYANNSINFWNSTDTWCFTISQNSTNPVHLIMSKDSWVTNYTDSNISVYTTESLNIYCHMGYSNSGNCNIYVDGNLVSNPYSSTIGVGEHAIKVNTSGNENYTSNSTGLTAYVTSSIAPGGGGSGGGGSSWVTATNCTYNWTCIEWSACAGRIQTRICTNLGTCKDTKGKPLETQGCIEKPTSNVPTNITQPTPTVPTPAAVPAKLPAAPTVTPSPTTPLGLGVGVAAIIAISIVITVIILKKRKQNKRLSK